MKKSEKEKELKRRRREKIGNRKKNGFQVFEENLCFLVTDFVETHHGGSRKF